VTKPEIEVEGARQLKRALRQVEGGTSDLKEIHAKAAKIVEGAALPVVWHCVGRRRPCRLRKGSVCRADSFRLGRTQHLAAAVSL